MNRSTAAFVPNVALRASTFAPSTATAMSKPVTSTSSTSRNHQRRAANVTRMNTSLPDFEKIAQQLSAELQKRTVSEEDLKPMPPTDAPSSEQPIVVTEGNNEMPKVILRHPPSQQEVEIYIYGAAVTSWTTKGENHFWISDTNKWQSGGKPIRGGIPICFPQFGPYGNLATHGFARASNWKIRHSYVHEDNSVTANFGLTSESCDENDDKYEMIEEWGYKFDAEYSVTLSNIGLECKLSVKNLEKDKDLKFTCAFHNYFAVTNIKNSRVFGYEDTMYLDRLLNDKECAGETDEGSGLLVENELDRIYKNTPDELAMFDFGSMKVLKIKKTDTLKDATLWNPYGAEGADPGWENFICMEPACITNPAVVKPGDTWVGAQLLGVE